MGNVKVEDTGTSNPKNETEDEVFDYDKILQEEVGQFGWFQIRNIILALISVMFLAWGNNSYVFTAARIPTRCAIPECDVAETEFTPDWLLNAVPGTDLKSFDNCQRYANASSITTEDGVCLASWFDRNHKESCEQHMYENTDTIVYDFDLACDEWRRSMVGSIRLSGTIFAQTITGLVSDRWGRRTALVFNAFNTAWIGVLRSFSPNFTVFVITEFISAVIGSATFPSIYILLTELASPDKRVFVGTCLNTFFSSGLMALGLIAWLVPYWRNLMRVLFIPQLLTIVYLWIMIESVRWYISKDRYEDAKKTLKRIARANNRQISDKSLEIIRKKVEEIKMKQKKNEDKEQKTTLNEPSLIKLLFQYKTVLFRCLILPFMWIIFTLIYHGITINAVDISGNKYVNYISVAGAQIPGYWVSLLLLDRIGRKIVLIGSYWICAVCQIVFIFVPKSQYVVSMTVYMIGASCSGAMMTALYIYTAELYPTQYRHRLFGFCSTVGRFGSVLAPLTPALGALVWDQFPFALFAGCACVAGALVLLMPETRGLRLPDTMQEAADLGRCRIPECDLAEPEFTPEWLLSAVPGTSLNSFDNCQRYANTSLENLQEGECPATWFDRNQLQKCEEYVYENTETIVYDFDLACDEWRRSMVGSIRLSGTIFSHTITGFVSDRWGRRTALVFNAFNTAWIAILRSFSPNYIMFVATEFISAVVGSATFQSGYILMVELVAPDKRVLAGACMNTFTSLGLIIMGLTAWAVPHWRSLTRVLFIPQLLTITYLYIMTESVRWYISKNRYEDVEKSLKNIARVNKKNVSETTLRILKKKANEGIMKQQDSREKGNENKQNEPSLFKLLLKYKPVLVRSLITPFWWISFTLIHQGITINAVDISGNKYVNYIAVSCAQIPGFWISLLLLDKIGRKPVLMGSYLLCAACEITFIFVPNDQHVLSLAVYMVGATCSGAIFSSVYIYTAELYPTQFRHTLFGFSSTVGRFGSVLAPLTPALGAMVWVHLPFALFAGCACVSGALVLLTPETRGVRLPDTMQEAADLGRKKHSTDI